LFLLLFIIHFSNFAYANYVVKEVTSDGMIELKNSNKIKIRNIYIPNKIRKNTVNYLSKMLNYSGSEIEYNIKGRDIYGNIYSDEVLYKNKNIITELLKKGFALKYSVENHKDVDGFIDEEYAMKNKLGLWSEDNKIFINKSELEENSWYYRNHFKVVEGEVVDVKVVNDKLYINFGDDWKSDFTVKVLKKNLKNFESLDFLSLKGKTILVKGWIEFYNGPLMEIYNPSHIKVM
jgi:hypothetical protein